MNNYIESTDRFELLGLKFLDAWKEYQSEAIQIFSQSFDLVFDELGDYGISYYYRNERRWEHESTYSITRLTGKMAVEKLVELSEESDFKTWVFYVENKNGNPMYFLEYDGYSFNSDYISGEE